MISDRFAMVFFPLVFVTAMASLHAYFYFILRRAFGPGAWRYGALAFLVLSVAALLLRRRIAALDAPWLGQALFYWLGFLIIVCLSNGTRHWGPPVRFLTPPEITVIDLIAKPKG